MRTSILICITGLVLLLGCEAQKRYEALSFFFDGVPTPEDAVAIDDASAGRNTPTAGLKQTASKHGPYAARLCDACHQSGTNRLLATREEICLKCHVFQPVKRRHGPVVAGGCLVCHDPHRSSFSFLLVSEAKDFCFFCHDRNEVITRDVHRGNDMTCTECHNPHGSDNDFLLR